MVVKRARRTSAAVAGSLLLMLGLSSCSLIEGPTPVTPERPQVEVPAEPAQFIPGGSAEENLPFFTQLLSEYSAGDQPIQGQPIVDAVAAGGFDKAAMQVSFDHSQTNLVADSIYVAVRSDETCLIGQLVTEDREVATQAVAAVGPDRNVCLIGNTRPIDW
ncbi:hypothetical protein ACI1US_01422 [Leucobacter sp. BZR 635]